MKGADGWGQLLMRHIMTGRSLYWALVAYVVTTAILSLVREHAH